MKNLAIRKLTQKLGANQAAFGMWVTLESPSIAEIATALDLDWIVIDAEHGHLDWKEIIDHLRATVRSDTVALVRITECTAALVKRALDIGADGIVIPWMESAEQLRQVVAFAHYPPAGVRGIGGERATGWGQCIAEHVREAKESILVVPMIESVRGGQNIREMLAVDGVDIYFFGPADYSSSAGYPGQWEGPSVAEQLLEIKDRIRGAGKYCGIMATSEANLLERQSQGFQLLSLGSDTGLLLRSLHSSLAAVGRDRKINTAFSANSGQEALVPLARPPESFCPDRPEVINELGSGNKIEIQPGVVFECLVGAHNKAKDMTTGIVTVAPMTRLAYHQHPTTESITLIDGSAAVEVEGRRYRLSRLDNVVVPPGIAHSVENTSAARDASFHIAFPTDAPVRELVDIYFDRQLMPDDSCGPGMPKLERVNRIKLAPRFEGGPGATFIDFFNDELIPGIEMSGGYAEFRPAGRLPAHIHDFDESICIVEGTANCIVEGRRYEMSGLSTALQPRGRVHYFVNNDQQPMAMIWVYAGPKPVRIVVEERNATSEGNPWCSDGTS